MLDRWIEPLNCRWSECVFLSPVDPRHLIADAARHPCARKREWLVVDVARLEPSRAVLMTPTRWTAGMDGPPAVSRHQCTAFTLAGVAAAAMPSRDTVARLDDPANRLPLWADIVHVLYRGSVDIANASTLVT
jgi:hypothetical protein